ncbi:MAG TPA: hypothetical protein VL551_34540 [Actinospica sp.]|jgi:hypothetical protein|nr:hypothetical protein [Actinospica sp.]
MASIGAGIRAWKARRTRGAASNPDTSGTPAPDPAVAAVLVEIGRNGARERDLDPDALRLSEAGLAGPELARAVERGRDAVLALFYAALATGQADILLAAALVRACFLYEPGCSPEPDVREATEWGAPVVTGLRTLAETPEDRAPELVAGMVELMLSLNGADREDLVVFLAERAASVDRYTGGAEVERAIAAIVEPAAEALGAAGLGYPLTMLLAILKAGFEKIAFERLVLLTLQRPGVLAPLHTLLLALAGNTGIAIPAAGGKTTRARPPEETRVLATDRRIVALLQRRRMDEAAELADEFRNATERTQNLACWILANALAESLPVGPWRAG